MIVNTDAGRRPLQGNPLEFKKMISGGNGDMNYRGYGAFPNMSGFGAFPSMSGFGADDASPAGDSSTISTIDSILSSGAKLGQAYTSYLTRNRPVAGATVVQPSTGGGVPIWVWVAGGAVLIGGAYFLFLRK